jgi:hypothetical protein
MRRACASTAYYGRCVGKLNGYAGRRSLGRIPAVFLQPPVKRAAKQQPFATIAAAAR